MLLPVTLTERDIASLLLGDLEPEEADAVRRWIDSDPAGGETLRQMETTLEALQAWRRWYEALPPPRLPSTGGDAVLRPRTFRRLALAASVILAAVIGIRLLRPIRQGPAEPRRVFHFARDASTKAIAGAAKQEPRPSERLPFKEALANAAVAARVRLRERAKGERPELKEEVRLHISRLGRRDTRDEAYGQLPVSDVGAVAILVDSYYKETNLDIRRRILSLLGRMDKGDCLHDVVAFVKGECVGTNQKLRVAALNALADIMGFGGRLKRDPSVRKRDYDEAVRLLIILANEKARPPFSKVQEAAARRLYRMGKGAQIPKELRKRFKASGRSFSR